MASEMKLVLDFSKILHCKAICPLPAEDSWMQAYYAAVGQTDRETHHSSIAL